MHSQTCSVCISSFEYPHHLHSHSSILEWLSVPSDESSIFELTSLPSYRHSKYIKLGTFLGFWFLCWDANILATSLRSWPKSILLIVVECSQQTRPIRQPPPTRAKLRRILHIYLERMFSYVHVSLYINQTVVFWTPLVCSLHTSGHE